MYLLGDIQLPSEEEAARKSSRRSLNVNVMDLHGVMRVQVRGIQQTIDRFSAKSLISSYPLQS